MSAVTKCMESDDKIVKVLSLFSNEWIPRLPEIFSQTDKYFIAVYPYKEDVQIEPDSLYNFIYPLFTEIFIDDVPGPKKTVGIKSPEFEEFEITKRKIVYAETMGEMHMTPMLKNKMSDVICNMRKITGRDNRDAEIAFVLLPYAVATMQTSYLISVLKNKDGLKISKQLMEQIISMYGAPDE